MQYKSFVYIKEGQVQEASNDGMQVLGHFLTTQVSKDVSFFEQWLSDARDAAISSHSYYVEKNGDTFTISSLEDKYIVPFETTRGQFMDLIKQWESMCCRDRNSVCGPDGISAQIVRYDDGKIVFNTLKH